MAGKSRPREVGHFPKWWSEGWNHVCRTPLLIPPAGACCGSVYRRLRSPPEYVHGPEKDPPSGKWGLLLWTPAPWWLKKTKVFDNSTTPPLSISSDLAPCDFFPAWALPWFHDRDVLESRTYRTALSSQKRLLPQFCDSSCNLTIE